MVSQLLTTSERCLLHLLDFRGLDDAFEYPMGVTQKGIAQSIGSQRKHMPRVLRKLANNGLVTETRGRVKDSKQKMKIYLLTMDGVARAKKIQQFAKNKRIKVRGKKGDIIETKLGEVNTLVEGEFSLMEIISNTSDEGIFEGVTGDMEIIMAQGDMPPKHEIYWHTMLQVWKDGKASVDEEEILEELRKVLKISDEEHLTMEEKIIRYAYPVRKKLLELYSAAYQQALKDKHITEDERALLEVLREKLGIREEELREIEGGMN